MEHYTPYIVSAVLLAGLIFGIWKLKKGGSATSGSYVPTYGSVVNVAEFFHYNAQWLRVGNVVTVSGAVRIAPKTLMPTIFTLTLPIASNFTANGQCAGSCAVIGNVNRLAAVYPNTVDNTVQIGYVADLTSVQDAIYHFTYSIR